MDVISVVIADDHAIIRDTVRRTLLESNTTHSYHIVAEPQNGLDTVVAIREHEPDLLILDISMPLANGTDIVTDVLHWSPDTRIVVLTGIVAPGILATMVNAGVHGVFSKTAPLEDLIDALPLIFKDAKIIAPELVCLLYTSPSPRDS